jgi:hypothetical protein
VQFIESNFRRCRRAQNLHITIWMGKQVFFDRSALLAAIREQRAAARRTVQQQQSPTRHGASDGGFC